MHTDTEQKIPAGLRRLKGEHFVGIDLHKKFMQVAVMNQEGKELLNTWHQQRRK